MRFVSHGLVLVLCISWVACSQITGSRFEISSEKRISAVALRERVPLENDNLSKAVSYFKSAIEGSTIQAARNSLDLVDAMLLNSEIKKKEWEDILKMLEISLNISNSMELLGRGNSSPRALYSLGLVSEAAGLHNQAWRYFHEAKGNGKSHLNLPQDPNSEVSLLSSLSDWTNLVNREDKGVLLPIFVTGLSYQSVLSILGHILAQHSRIHSDNPLAKIVDHRVRRDVMSEHVEVLLNAIQSNGDFGTTILDSIAENILKSLTSAKTPSKSAKNKQSKLTQSTSAIRYVVYVDPEHVVATHLLFPRAVIIHMVRDPMDTVMEIFRMPWTHAVDKAENPFRQGSYLSLGEVSAAYVKYLAIMSEFRRLTGKAMYEVYYDDMLKSPRAVLEQALTQTGLQWEDSMNHWQRAGFFYPFQCAGAWKAYHNELADSLAELRQQIKDLQNKGTTLPLTGRVNWNMDEDLYLNDTCITAQKDSPEFIHTTRTSPLPHGEVKVDEKASERGSAEAEGEEVLEVLPMRRGRNRGVPDGGLPETISNDKSKDISSHQSSLSSSRDDHSQTTTKSSPPGPSSQLSGAEDIQKTFDRFYNAHDFVSALEIAQAEISRYPFEPTGFRHRASLCLLDKDYDCAEKNLDVALYLNPSHVPTLLHKSNILSRQRALLRARLYAQGAVDASAGETHAAVGLERALALDSLGLINMMLKQYDWAHQAFESALQLVADEEDAVDIRLHHAQMYIETGMWKQARCMLETVQRGAGKYAIRATLVLATMYYEMGLPTIALSALEPIWSQQEKLAKEMTAAAVELIANCFIMLGEFDRAYEILTQSEIVLFPQLVPSSGGMLGALKHTACKWEQLGTSVGRTFTPVESDDITCEMPDMIDVDRNKPIDRILNDLNQNNIDFEQIPSSDMFHLVSNAYRHVRHSYKKSLASGALPHVRYDMALTFAAMDIAPLLRINKNSKRDSQHSSDYHPCTSLHEGEEGGQNNTHLLDLLCRAHRTGDDTSSSLLSIIQIARSWYLTVRPQSPQTSALRDVPSDMGMGVDIVVSEGESISPKMSRFYSSLFKLLRKRVASDGVYTSSFETSERFHVNLSKKERKIALKSKNFCELFAILGESFEVPIRDSSSTFDAAVIRLVNNDPLNCETLDVHLIIPTCADRAEAIQKMLLKTISSQHKTSSMEGKSYRTSDLAFLLFLLQPLNSIEGNEFMAQAISHAIHMLSDSPDSLCPVGSHRPLDLISILIGGGPSHPTSTATSPLEPCSYFSSNSEASLERMHTEAEGWSPADRLDLVNIMIEHSYVVRSEADGSGDFTSVLDDLNNDPADAMPVVAASALALIHKQSESSTSLATLIVSALDKFEFGVNYRQKREKHLSELYHSSSRKRLDHMHINLQSALDRYYDSEDVDQADMPIEEADSAYNYYHDSTTPYEYTYGDDNYNAATSDGYNYYYYYYSDDWGNYPTNEFTDEYYYEDEEVDEEHTYYNEHYDEDYYYYYDESVGGKGYDTEDYYYYRYNEEESESVYDKGYDASEEKDYGGDGSEPYYYYESEASNDYDYYYYYYYQSDDVYASEYAGDDSTPYDDEGYADYYYEEEYYDYLEASVDDAYYLEDNARDEEGLYYYYDEEVDKVGGEVDDGYVHDDSYYYEAPAAAEDYYYDDMDADTRFYAYEYEYDYDYEDTEADVVYDSYDEDSYYYYEDMGAAGVEEEVETYGYEYDYEYDYDYDDTEADVVYDGYDEDSYYYYEDIGAAGVEEEVETYGYEYDYEYDYEYKDTGGKSRSSGKGGDEKDYYYYYEYAEQDAEEDISKEYYYEEEEI